MPVGALVGKLVGVLIGALVVELVGALVAGAGLKGCVRGAIVDCRGWRSGGNANCWLQGLDGNCGGRGATDGCRSCRSGGDSNFDQGEDATSLTARAIVVFAGAAGGTCSGRGSDRWLQGLEGCGRGATGGCRVLRAGGRGNVGRAARGT